MFSNFLRILGNCSYYCEWLNSVISDFKACDHCLLTGNMKFPRARIPVLIYDQRFVRNINV